MVSVSVADPDPGSGAFLTPGSGMGRKSGSRTGIWFFWVKILNSLKRIRDEDSSDPGWKKSDPGSGINIPDPQHWFCSSHWSGTCSIISQCVANDV